MGDLMKMSLIHKLFTLSLISPLSSFVSPRFSTSDSSLFSQELNHRYVSTKGDRRSNNPEDLVQTSLKVTEVLKTVMRPLFLQVLCMTSERFVGVWTTNYRWTF